MRALYRKALIIPENCAIQHRKSSGMVAEWRRKAIHQVAGLRRQEDPRHHEGKERSTVFCRLCQNIAYTRATHNLWRTKTPYVPTVQAQYRKVASCPLPATGVPQ